MAEAVPNTLLFPLLAYTAASVSHFVHNAVFLESYPNMPEWITVIEVYSALAGLLALGTLGYALCRAGYRLAGLMIIGIYAGFGFDGLAHYSLAPISAHTTAMNLTIWSEAATAALLLAIVVDRIVRRTRRSPSSLCSSR